MSNTMASTPYQSTVLHVKNYGSAMGYMVWRCGNDCTKVVEGASMVPLWSTQRYVGDGTAPFRSRSGLYPTMSQDTGVSEGTLETYFGLGDLLVNQLGMSQDDVVKWSSKIHNGLHAKHLRRLAKDNCFGEIQEYLDILKTHEGRDVADKETVDRLLVAAGLKTPSSKSAPAPRLDSVPEVRKNDIPDAIIAKAVNADGFKVSSLDAVLQHFDKLPNDDKVAFFNKRTRPEVKKAESKTNGKAKTAK
jgi:hypothetical protein